MIKIGAVILFAFLILIVYPFVVGTTFPIDKMPKSLDVTAVIDSKRVELCVISQGEAQYQLLINTLQDNAKGWRVDFNSYLPTLKLSSNQLKIIISNNWVANYETDFFGWIQLSKKVRSNLSKDNICN
jgi:hypothetical protein